MAGEPLPPGGSEEGSSPEPSAAPGADRRARARQELEERVREELAPHLEIVRPLGRGSAASVYLAREPALRRLVAVKVLSPELASDRKARVRFEREAQSAARISHPNVVTLYRVGVLSDDLPYLVMQHVRGRSLAERLRAEGQFPVPEVRRILADLASGLADAHRRRIVHRDVKPANVLYEEETGRVFLTDFGLAATLASGDEEVARLTTRGHVVGDLRYRSPEQLLGEEVTELADVYGLGLLGYELLTLESPYEHRNTAELLAGHLREPPRPVRAFRPDVDPDLEALLVRCLQKVPAHRPSAADVVRHLSAPLLRPGTPAPGVGRPALELGAPGADLGAAGPAPAPPAPSEAGAGVETREPEAPYREADRPADLGASADGGRAGAPAVEEPPVAVRPPRGVIRFHALGALDLRAADGRRLLSVLAQPKRVALVAYLAIGSSRGFKRRDSLLGVFWPDVEQERARHALRQAVYVLRRSLGGEVIVSRGDEEIGIADDEVWCDALAFERAVDAGATAEALEWYKGDLLPGFFLADALEFERWLDAERQRLRRLASDAAWSLAALRESEGNPAAAAHWARRAVELDPWDESSLCRLLQLLDGIGDRAGAIRAYEQFASRLRAEYEAEPAPETQALIRQVRER